MKVNRAHYRYSYDQAIADGACRPVQFVEVRGSATFRSGDNRIHTVSFEDQSLSEAGNRFRLRSAIEWVGEGSIAKKMLADANQYILGLRKNGDTDAAGLVVCIDCDHASRVADFMSREVLTFRPLVACSNLYDENDPDPANAIRQFRSSHDPWIVAVNMVSEGVDIRRLRVVVYLTNRLTPLSFKQIVGRVVRTDASNIDDHGRVYIPADPTLLDMAHHVTEQIDLLPKPIIIYMDRTKPLSFKSPVYGEPSRGTFETLNTFGEQGAAFDTFGNEASRHLVDCARLFIEREGLTGTDPESLALAASEAPELRAALLSLMEET